MQIDWDKPLQANSGAVSTSILYYGISIGQPSGESGYRLPADLADAIVHRLAQASKPAEMRIRGFDLARRKYPQAMVLNYDKLPANQ